MIISDERFATATVVEGDRGNQPLLFDDFNCQLIFEKKHPELVVVNRWSHDYFDSSWFDAEQGWFVHSTQIHSPMASNMVFFQLQADADKFAETVSGVVMNFETAWAQSSD
jgi:NosL